MANLIYWQRRIFWAWGCAPPLRPLAAGRRRASDLVSICHWLQRDDCCDALATAHARRAVPLAGAAPTPQLSDANYRPLVRFGVRLRLSVAAGARVCAALSFHRVYYGIPRPLIEHRH